MQEKKLLRTLKAVPEPAPWLTPKLSVFDTLKTIKVKTKHKISPVKLLEEFLNEIRNDEEHINNEIFREYFGYQNTSSLATY